MRREGFLARLPGFGRRTGRLFFEDLLGLCCRLSKPTPQCKTKPSTPPLVLVNAFRRSTLIAPCTQISFSSRARNCRRGGAVVYQIEFFSQLGLDCQDKCLQMSPVNTVPADVVLTVTVKPTAIQHIADDQRFQPSLGGIGLWSDGRVPERFLLDGIIGIGIVVGHGLHSNSMATGLRTTA
jgi:hypothetical protein